MLFLYDHLSSEIEFNQISTSKDIQLQQTKKGIIKSA